MTVIVTVHRELLRHLQRCIDSIVWQLSDGDQCFVICDGLNDEEAEIIQVEHPRCSVIAIPKSGVSAARNEGLRRTASEWVKFIDADDVLAPFAIETFNSLGTKNTLSAVVAGAQVKVVDGVVCGTVMPPVIEAYIAEVNPLIISQTFIRRAELQAVEGFDERIEFEEDWDVWLKLWRNGQHFDRVAFPVCYYWRHNVEQAAKVRSHTVEGVDVREYFRRKYDITPA